MELWKRIEFFDDYEVSNYGNVKSYKKIKNGGYLKKIKMTNEYFCVGLYKKGKLNLKLIHHLVLESFDKKRPEGLICNHKDGNKLNNYIKNLEWVTYKVNNIHALKTGLRVYTKEYRQNLSKSLQGKNAKLKPGEVWLIKYLLKNNINQYNIAKMFNINKCTVSRINTGKRWKHINLNH